jgi:hypothetical protein
MYIIKKISFKRKYGRQRRQWADYSIDEKRIKTAARVKQQYAEIMKSNKMISTLKDIFTLCEENDIYIVGLKFPMTKEYLAAMTNQQNTLNDIFISNNIEIINFSHSFIEYNNLFADVDHLNNTGGKLLSTMINNKLNK